MASGAPVDQFARSPAAETCRAPRTHTSRCPPRIIAKLSAWWKYAAPEPRRRLGGVGQPAFEVSASAEAYEIGLPTIWVTPADVDRRGTAFEGVPIDPDDPPRFESEAHYLRRLGLLLPGEMGRLTEADFEPEKIEVEADPDEAA